MKFLRPILLALAAMACAMPAMAGPGDSDVLIQNGRIYRLRSMTWGQLHNQVVNSKTSELDLLVLQVANHNGSQTNHTIPSSFTIEADTEGMLFQHAPSRTIYVLWIARGQYFDEVRLATYRDGEFLSDDVISDGKRARRLHLDATLNESRIASGELKPILQVVWWEQPISFSGQDGVRYLPLIVQHDGSIRLEKRKVVDASATDTQGVRCSGQDLPDVIRRPAVKWENETLSHLTVFTPDVCQFAVVPATFEEFVEQYQAHFIPFIGVRYEIDPVQEALMTDQSWFDSADRGDLDVGYDAAATWIPETDMNSLHYRIWDAGDRIWSDEEMIPLNDEMSIEKARYLVLNLID